ncbi:TnsA endonuclease N-terminal domain-containing protein [Acetobacterium wieringae]|uniref:TnsA endonuclease N-terminal domain-containing protein n=1 Tax=Acetobacterium wieringae TaxID=52694 RepID=UPI0026F32060|nr:TnsA endonuclease N-terminal domain-containing protein [Acetobacterium wieringae]
MLDNKLFGGEILAKRSRKNSIDKKLKEGRGIGAGIDYKPWLVIQDVSSLGRSTRLKGIKIPRQYEFLSDLEKNYFYLLEFSDYVVDIREQYPLLPLEDTLLIADELGIIHPRNPQTNEPIVMSTDFVVTMKNDGNIKDHARTVKMKKELSNERILEKFEIERVYWERHQIDWGIVTEEEINKTTAQNIGFVHSYKELTNFEDFKAFPEIEMEDLLTDYINRMLRTSSNSIRTISKEFERDFGLNAGSGLTIFKHLIISKIIDVNLKVKLDINENIPIEAIYKDFSLKESVI